MGRGRRRHGPRGGRDRRARDPHRAPERAPRRTAAGRTPRTGRRVLLASVLALPVGLGTAAALVLATSAGPGLTSQATAPGAGAGADNGLPPAADDFFAGSGQDPDTQGGADGGGTAGSDGANGGDGPAEGSASGEDSVRPSEEPADGGDGDREGSSSGSSGGSGGSEDSGSSGGSSSGPSAAGSAASGGVVALTNDERADAGCGPLQVDAKLTRASEDHSADMARRDYMAHETPEGVGPAERAEKAGHTAWGGENVAAGYTSAEAVMDGWMNSEGHRKNILNCDFTTIGVGEVDGYWTQNFGYS
ncbi:CAP domain-containing protein [Nocardiopsis halophila]|uniref:CAP domain-containing protein n=1 Tax=Nocardiopsis halophila TaxID=141692 RepID=UPI00034CD4A9|nr:CAP domain-containing protein [Nocardiopsis halophila]